MSDCQHKEYWATCNCCGRRWWISSAGLHELAVEHAKQVDAEARAAIARAEYDSANLTLDNPPDAKP